MSCLFRIYELQNDHRDWFQQLETVFESPLYTGTERIEEIARLLEDGYTDLERNLKANVSVFPYQTPSYDFSCNAVDGDTQKKIRDLITVYENKRAKLLSFYHYS